VTKRQLVSVVAPVYNEEQVIEEFVRRLTQSIAPLQDRYDFEILLVDDDSHDRSRMITKRLMSAEPKLRLVELSRHFGQTHAIQAGIDSAAGDILVTLDSDLQHFPEDIPSFMLKLEEGYDMVCGWRYRRVEGWRRRWPSLVANYMIKMISGLTIHDFGTTFRACRMDVARDIRILGEFHRYIPALGSFLGARITEIPIQNIERPSGKSNYGLARSVGVMLDLILLYFFTHYLDRPMRAFGKIALITFSIGATIILWLVVYAYMYNFHAVQERSGWFLISLVLIIASVQVLMAGIIAEILVRMHYGSGNRHFYRIRRIWRSEEVA
jgi:glycosyltransferase involved in cell wall biosynthesis